VGSTEEITILELAKKVVEITGSSSRIRMVPYENVYGDGFEDMLRRIPSLERVHSLVGWHPLTSLDTIINDIIADMKSRTLMV
jgi:UDP-glucose 4-epimerase